MCTDKSSPKMNHRIVSRTLSPNGYVRIYISGIGRVFEHRWVMEQHLGRKIHRTEHVHHMNGNRTDNRIENLQLVDASIHNRLHEPRIVTKAKSWAKGFDRCIECDTTSRPHRARGLCRDCYRRRYRVTGRTIKGSNHPKAKLTDDQVREIRARIKSGEYGTRLAKEFGVTNGLIYMIKNGRIWTHLE